MKYVHTYMDNALTEKICFKYKIFPEDEINL